MAVVLVINDFTVLSHCIRVVKHLESFLCQHSLQSTFNLLLAVCVQLYYYLVKILLLSCVVIICTSPSTLSDQPVFLSGHLRMPYLVVINFLCATANDIKLLLLTFISRQHECDTPRSGNIHQHSQTVWLCCCVG